MIITNLGTDAASCEPKAHAGGLLESMFGEGA